MKIISILTNLISVHVKPIFRQMKIEAKYSHVKFKGKNAIKNVTFGNFVKVYEGTFIANAKVGAYTYIGGNCKVQYASIGKFCSIGPNVQIGLGFHPTHLISTYPGFYSDKASGAYSFNVIPDFLEHGKISIGNDVWIGEGALVLDGVSIGNGAVIGARAIVTKDIPDFAIVAGVPAKIIKYRFSKKEIKVINDSKWWNWSHKQLKARAKYFASMQMFLKFSSDEFTD